MQAPDMIRLTASRLCGGRPGELDQFCRAGGKIRSEAHRVGMLAELKVIAARVNKILKANPTNARYADEPRRISTLKAYLEKAPICA